LDEKIGGVEAGLKEELKYLREVDQETENKIKSTNADIERNRNQISRLREDLESRPAPKADVSLGDISPLLEALRQEIRTELDESQENQDV